MNNVFYFKSKKGFPEWETKAAIQWLLKNEGKKCWADLGRETGIRTLPQNSALHLGLTMIATILNESGLDMRKVLKPHVDIPWTPQSVKEHLWRPIQKVMTGKSSTTQLDKIEPGEIWDVIMRHLGEKHGVEYIPFPSKQRVDK